MVSGWHTEKDLQALEQKRKDVAEQRRIRIAKRQPFMANHLERLVFIDEASVKTNMARTTGWAPCGQRLVDHAPFGHWRTQTFVAALRHDRLEAPLGHRRRDEQRDLHPLRRNPAGADPARGRRRHSRQPVEPQGPGAAAALRAIGAWFLFLPPYSPDLNPIEMAFSKLKTLVRKATARTYDQLWAAVGHVCDLFTDEECYNYFKAAGHEAN